jgi:hypothetical protein
MIERLPLEIFGGEREPEAGESLANGVDEIPNEMAEEATEAGQDIVLARCQWCGKQFDDDLSRCPYCDAAHARPEPVEEESATVTCQWCLTEFERSEGACPSCQAMVVIPGQYVLGQDDAMPARSLLAQRAQSHQFLVGMMAGGGLDALAAGLIGLAFTLFDDD